MDEKTVLDVKVGGVVKGGVVAYVEGIRGFIPASKLSLSYVENLEDWLNKEIQVQVITVDPEKKRLVLSAREILREKAAEERRAKISNVQVGFVTEGKVESIQPYGAFIDPGRRTFRPGSRIPDFRQTHQDSRRSPEGGRHRKGQGHRHQGRQAFPEHESPEGCGCGRGPRGEGCASQERGADHKLRRAV